MEIQIFWPLTTYSSPSRDRRGAEVREVGAGLGLAEALAPVLVGREDPGQPRLLLLLGAPRDDHRADLPDAVRVVDARRAHPRHLLGVDDVLHRRGLAAAPVLRPVDRGPAALVEAALPVLAALLACGRCRAWRPPPGILVAAPVGEELRQVARRASRAARRGTPRPRACRRSPSRSRSLYSFFQASACCSQLRRSSDVCISASSRLRRGHEVAVVVTSRSKVVRGWPPRACVAAGDRLARSDRSRACRRCSSAVEAVELRRS